MTRESSHPRCPVVYRGGDLVTPATHVPSASPAPCAKPVAIGLASAGLLGVALALSRCVLRRRHRTLADEAQVRVELEQGTRTGNALLGMVSHELRTPLQAIMAGADLLSQPCSQDEVRAIVERMNRSLDVMAGKLDTFSRYARLASGVEPVRRERLDLAELMRRVTDDHPQRSRPDGRGSPSRWTRGPVPSSRAIPSVCSRSSTTIANAVKYSARGDIRIRCSMSDVKAGGVAAGCPMIEIAVEDRGPGIAEADRRPIWEPYYRGARGSGDVKGSGLGLAVVRLLASSAGWDTGVRDVVGGGLAFYVRFPHSPSRRTP